MDSQLLRIEDVCKGYCRGSEWSDILVNVSFDVRPGEVVAITGSRSEGKTTLLKVAAGMERPEKGTVSLGDSRLMECRDREHSRRLGRQIVWVDRHGPKLKMEVAKFVGLPQALHGGKRHEVERAAAQMLERVGARKCLTRTWGELSNWQRVLVGLARGFAGSPQVVVIDDLLDGLGGPATEEASDLLRSLIEASEPSCGVLMSASDMESALYADRVWSITGKRSLKLMAGAQVDGTVVPFPDRGRTKVGGSHGVGSP